MAKPTKEQKYIMEKSREVTRRGQRKAGRSIRPSQSGILQGEFHKILDKASQPIESGLEQEQS